MTNSLANQKIAMSGGTLACGVSFRVWRRLVYKLIKTAGHDENGDETAAGRRLDIAEE